MRLLSPARAQSPFPRRIATVFTVWIAGWTALAVARGAEVASAPAETRVRVYSVAEDGTPLPIPEEGRARLAANPKLVSFAYGPATNVVGAPLRIRYRLDGLDEEWKEPAGEMRIGIRFMDANGDQVGETSFAAIGQSEGWTGRLETSPFHTQQRTVVVPEQAAAIWLVLSSAGPPNAVGSFWISNLVVSRATSGGDRPRVLIPWAFAPGDAPDATATEPHNWMRDGLRATMAKVSAAGPGGISLALGIEDDDVSGHAEWRMIKEQAPAVTPGEELRIDWAWAHSLGLAGRANAHYPELSAGFFRFRINGLELNGTPGPDEASLSIEVPVAAWKTPWFWVAVAAGLATIGVGGWRLAEGRRMQNQLRRLEQQRAVENERLRIAQDIHDDLGARVTQISLFSAMAQKRESLPPEARADFGEVSRLTRSLVGALYETVWSVNPENDSLDALANFLCQMGNQLCAEAQLRCRLEVPSLPPSLPLTSQVRHNLAMAVKEAVHNTIKHAAATEVRIAIAFEHPRLTISIQDDGRGFDLSRHEPGNGLGNLRRRMESIGGSFQIESTPGEGTRVVLRLEVPTPAATPSVSPSL